MFGSNKKTVVLTKEEEKKLLAEMTPRQRKEYAKRQRQAEDERFFDALLLSELFEDD